MDFYRQYNNIPITLEKVSKTRWSKKYTFTYLWLRFSVVASDESTAFQAAYNHLLKARM